MCHYANEKMCIVSASKLTKCRLAAGLRRHRPGTYSAPMPLTRLKRRGREVEEAKEKRGWIEDRFTVKAGAYESSSSPMDTWLWSNICVFFAEQVIHRSSVRKHIHHGHTKRLVCEWIIRTARTVTTFWADITCQSCIFTGLQCCEVTK